MGGLSLEAKATQLSKAMPTKRGNPVCDAVGEPIFHNRYSYANSNPVNRTDPSGLCPPRVNPLGGQFEEDATACHQLVDKLRTWNIMVTWQEDAFPPLTCIPETVQRAANEEDKQQRWTTGEMRAIYNAFKIFEGAHSEIGMQSVYNWPLSVPVTYIKKSYVGTSSADLIALGKHEYQTRTVTMSAKNWGEAEDTDYIVNSQIRAWLVLHEFTHIFVKDRRPPNFGEEFYATNTENGLPGQILARFGRVVPTGYATASEQERAIEVVTATLWNNGYSTVGFRSNAGGRTASIGATAIGSYNGVNFTLNNVRNIEAQGETLEDWIIANVILRNP